jgi:hypothetical protein
MRHKGRYLTFLACKIMQLLSTKINWFISSSFRRSMTWALLAANPTMHVIVYYDTDTLYVYREGKRTDIVRNFTHIRTTKPTKQIFHQGGEAQLQQL